ncbi:DMT family transporter [Kitasatospora sp. NPDC056138]|uniref:DMT family transporter n=1 Tax=Kitasatospora sp. NPDC056138 TaxID=3345724 RepID=UPI0035D6B01E
MTKAKPRWWDALLLLALIWGSSFLFVKVAVRVMPPGYVALARMAVGAVTLLLVLAATGQRLPRGRAVWGHSAVTALLVNVAPFTLFSWGEQHVSSVLAGIFNATTPVLAMLVAAVLLPDERPDRRRLVGLPIGFAGVLVVLGVWRGADGQSLAGQLACLAAAACYALGFPYAKRTLAGRPESTVALSAVQVLLGTAEGAVVAPLLSGGLPTDPGRWCTPPVIGSVLALGALCTGVAYPLNYRVIRRAGAVAATMVSYLMPLVAVVAGVLLLDERVTWNQPVGALVVLLGVAVAQGVLRRGGAGRAPVGPAPGEQVSGEPAPAGPVGEEVPGRSSA